MTTDPTALAIDSGSGHRLAARLWTNSTPRGVLVVAPGHGEHGGSYDEFARAVTAALPVDLVAIDFRGHGRSSGPRGVIRRYDDLLDDLEAWLGWVARERAGLPIFVVAHSNGGLTTIRLVETRQPRLAGLVLSNPALRLTAPAPLWKRILGHALIHIAPRVTFETGISHDQLTQADKATQIDDDPLRHQRISPATYFGMLAEGPRALAQAHRILTPTCLILGGADPVTDPAAGRILFENLAADDKTLLFYEALRHEPIHEVDRAAVIGAIIAWLGVRIETTLGPG